MCNDTFQWQVENCAQTGAIESCLDVIIEQWHLFQGRNRSKEFVCTLTAANENLFIRPRNFLCIVFKSFEITFVKFKKPFSSYLMRLFDATRKCWSHFF
jgi:hypothetical protein